MRKYIFAIFCLIFICSIKLGAQEISKERVRYILVKSSEGEFIEGAMKIYVDFGFSDYLELKDESGKGLKFNSEAHVLNFFSDRGWEYIESQLELHDDYLIFKKTITDEKQILEGFNVELHKLKEFKHLKVK